MKKKNRTLKLFKSHLRDDAKEKALVHIATYTLIITSLFYFLIKYFFYTQGEWGEQQHFLSPYLQKLHILLSPIFLFIMGSFFKEHVLKRIVSGVHQLRFSGICLTIFLFLLVLSGYLIQIVTEVFTRDVVSYFHLVISGIWLSFYIYHHIKSRIKT